MRPYPDAWARESATPVVERYHSAVRALVAEKFAASGKSWEEAVESGVLMPTREELEQIEADVLAEGYKFDVSATISLKEEIRARDSQLSEVRDRERALQEALVSAIEHLSFRYLFDGLVTERTGSFHWVRGYNTFDTTDGFVTLSWNRGEFRTG